MVSGKVRSRIKNTGGEGARGAKRKAVAKASAAPQQVLAIDVGGSNLKFCTQAHREPVKVKSGPKFTPEKMVRAIQDNTADWAFDCVSLGYPGLVIDDKPVLEPHNLAPGWVGFNYRAALGGKPLRILNDAAMQALGSDRGGRMLFLGLGTGLGAALVIDHVVTATELAHVPWRKGRTYEEFLGAVALAREGKKRWRRYVLKAIEDLRTLFECDSVVLGGGNAKLVGDLPDHVFLGSNDNAFKGAFMLWEPKHRGSR